MESVILAHVTYVTDPEASPDPLGFLLEVLGRPGNLLLLVVGAAVVLLAGLAWLRRRPMLAPWERFVAQAWSYRDLVPWMLRLSFGLVLIGSGLTLVVFASDVRLGCRVAATAPGPEGNAARRRSSRLGTPGPRNAIAARPPARSNRPTS